MENSCLPVLKTPNENVFLIDWLTVVFHGCYVDEVQRILGLESHKIPWETKSSFINGYPQDTFFDHIHIRWGADDPSFYKDSFDKTAEQKPVMIWVSVWICPVKVAALLRSFLISLGLS